MPANLYACRLVHCLRLISAGQYYSTDILTEALHIATTSDHT